jgi:hypothetical protein
MSRRRDTLSFQHHAEVAGLPEAERDLGLQRAERLRRSAQRAATAAGGRARAAHAGNRVEPDRSADATERETRWRRAAIAADQDLLDWIASVADDAADLLLDGSPNERSDRQEPQLFR